MFDDSILHNNILHDILTYSRQGIVCVTFDENDIETGVQVVESWLDLQSRNIKEEWKLIFQEFFRTSSIRKMGVVVRLCPDVKVNDFTGSSCSIKLDSIIEFLHKPKRIILENSDGDRRFLLSISNKNLRDKLVKLQAQGNLSFEHCGGIDGVATKLANDFGPELGSEVKCWVLIDSDSCVPGMVSVSAQKVIDICVLKGINYLCLKRRAIENYIPDDALQRFADANGDNARDTFLALSSLNLVQRDHYHMADGFGNKTCKNSGLYDELEKEVKKPLCKGFGRNIKHVYPENVADLQTFHEEFGQIPDEFTAPLKFISEMIRS
jgi:hypothetical protein